MNFNIIVGDVEYGKFVPGAYSNNVEQYVPLMFYTKTDTCIVDKKSVESCDLIFPSRSTVRNVPEIAKLIDTHMKTIDLAIIDTKSMRLVLDIEKDVPYVWTSYPPKSDECLVFSGDGRNILFTCWYQTKMSVWALNIACCFDISSLTMQGSELIVNWVASETKEALSYAIQDSIKRYCQDNIGTAFESNYFDGYNFSKLIRFADKIKLPSSKIEGQLLLPASSEVIDIVEEKIPLTSLIGKTDFDDYIGVDIEFDVPINMDILCATVDVVGHIVFTKRLGGLTSLEQIAEDFQLPIDKLFFQFREVKGEL